MSQNFYHRKKITHIDGTLIFQTPEDRAAEKLVADKLEEAWNLQVHHFPELSQIDWYLERDGRIVGLAELKRRDHASGKFSTVFLNLRKWWALEKARWSFKVPGVFVVEFLDGIKWILVKEVDGFDLKIGGARDDKEPVILVPVSAMQDL